LRAAAAGKSRGLAQTPFACNALAKELGREDSTIPSATVDGGEGRFSFFSKMKNGARLRDNFFAITSSR